MISIVPRKRTFFIVSGQIFIHIYTRIYHISITLLLSFLFLIIKGKDEKMKDCEITR